MSIYVIADLHLSLGDEDKPMDIFGHNWENYMEKIKENWLEVVKEDDLVILPGDFCWAMYLQDSAKDFEFINNLPGKKILLKGNHDYWWSTISKMRKFIKDNNFVNIDFLINNAYEFDNKIIVGTRGWFFADDEENIKILAREANRLELSIKDGIEKYGEDKEIVCMMHYPPITKEMITNNTESVFTEVMKKYGIKKCLYGHLHGTAHDEAIEGEFNGLEYKLISSDYMNFKPYLLK